MNESNNIRGAEGTPVWMIQAGFEQRHFRLDLVQQAVRHKHEVCPEATRIDGALVHGLHVQEDVPPLIGDWRPSLPQVRLEKPRH